MREETLRVLSRLEALHHQQLAVSNLEFEVPPTRGLNASGIAVLTRFP